jgi:hypothetical protein
MDLRTHAALWPTPNVPNGGRTLSPEAIEAKGSTPKGKRQVGLENVASLWPTPSVCGNHNRKGASSKSGDGLATASLSFPPDPLTEPLGPPSSETIPTSRRQLSAAFVVWLMGLPTFWLELGSVECSNSRHAAMRSYLSRLRRHLSSYGSD